MSILAITIPIHTYDSEGNTAEHIKSLLSGIRFDWEFYGERAQFSSFVCVRKKKNNIYKHELMLLKKLMGILPDDTDLQNEYKKYLILDKGAFEYDVELNFKGEIAVEIDIENNSALYYNGPKLQNLKHRDILFLKKYINDEMLDDFYERKTKSFVLAIVMSIVIAYPEIDINNAAAIVKFDEKKYREESFFSYYPIQNEAIAKYKNLMDVDVSFNDCFKWIKEHTSLEKEDYNTPTIFSSLTYVFNREMHEILVYSIIGLESIYAPKHGAVSLSFAE